MAVKQVPFRLAILMELSKRLRQITFVTDGGKSFPMTQRVYRGKNKLGDDQPPPTISILESPQQLDLSSTPARSTVSKDLWEILIKGDVTDTRDAYSATDNSHYLMAQVKAKLTEIQRELDGPVESMASSNILGMGGKVLQLQFGGGIVRPAEENISPCSFFWLPVTLTLAEERNSPYIDYDVQ